MIQHRPGMYPLLPFPCIHSRSSLVVFWLSQLCMFSSICPIKITSFLQYLFGAFSIYTYVTFTPYMLLSSIIHNYKELFIIIFDFHINFKLLREKFIRICQIINAWHIMGLVSCHFYSYHLWFVFGYCFFVSLEYFMKEVLEKMC